MSLVILVIDIYSNNLFLWILISSVAVVLYYLELTVLLLEHEVIWNAVTWFAARLDMTQFAHQVRIGLISQLIMAFQGSSTITQMF